MRVEGKGFWGFGVLGFWGFGIWGFGIWVLGGESRVREINIKSLRFKVYGLGIRV